MSGLLLGSDMCWKWKTTVEHVVPVVWFCSICGQAKKTTCEGVVEGRLCAVLFPCTHDQVAMWSVLIVNIKPPPSLLPDLTSGLFKIQILFFNLDHFCYRHMQMPPRLAKLGGLECCWHRQWDTGKQHNSLSCIKGFRTKDPHKTVPSDVKSNQRKSW